MGARKRGKHGEGMNSRGSIVQQIVTVVVTVGSNDPGIDW